MKSSFIFCLFGTEISAFLKHLSNYLPIFLVGCLSFSYWLVESLIFWSFFSHMYWKYLSPCGMPIYSLNGDFSRNSTQNNSLTVLKPQIQKLQLDLLWPHQFLSSSALMVLWTIFRIPLFHLIAMSKHISPWIGGKLGEPEVTQGREQILGYSELCCLRS